MNSSHSYGKGLDKEKIYFRIRLNIGITNFNNMEEFVSMTKRMKGRESKMRKNPKK